MQKIPLNMAKEGMKLAKPVTRDNGITIVAEGVELTETLIMRLENMGVEKIVVLGNPVDLGGTGLDTAFSRRVERMDHLFRHLDDPWMQKIKKLLKEYFEIKAAAQRQEEEEAEQAEEDEE